jgi:hypothetical protein
MVESIEDTSVRTVSKVVQVVPRRLRRRVDAVAPFAAGGPRCPVRPSRRICSLPWAQARRDDERLRSTFPHPRWGRHRTRPPEPPR